MTSSRVVLATLDTLGDKMAGPAIRCWEAARLLSGAGHEVRLVSFGQAGRVGEGFAVEHVTTQTFREVVEWADVLVIQGFLGAAFEWLNEVDVVVVVDLYDPFHIEILEVARDEPAAERELGLARAMHELGFQLARGDVFLCASERQRDLWIGHLAATGRVNPATTDADRDLAELVRVAPFGIDPTPPRRSGPTLRERVPELTESDTVLLWAGGVYNWFDPVTLVEAVDLLARERDDVRLVFMGMAHPNPDVARMRVAAETVRRCDELGLTGTRVFFLADWVPYDERGAVLLDADLGVSCHLPGLETRYSFRTRMLDYLWAGLPMVCTEGDFFADLVRERDLGQVVPPRDPAALAAAIRRVIDDPEGAPERARRVRDAASELVWPTALSQLLAVCDAPRRAADAGQARPTVTGPPRRGLLGTATSAIRLVRRAGWRALVTKVQARLHR